MVIGAVTTKTEPRLARAVIFTALSVSIGRVISAASGIIVVPLVISALGGTEPYGQWALVASAAALLSLLDLGLSNGLARLIARNRGHQRPVGQLLRTAFVGGLFGAVVTLIATAMLAWWLPIIHGGEVVTRVGTRDAIVILGCGVAASMPLLLGTPILMGNQRYGIHTIGSIVRSVLVFAGIFGTASLGLLDLRMMAFVTALGTVISGCLSLWLAYCFTGPWGILGARTSWRDYRVCLSLGWASLVVTASRSLTVHGTTLILGWICGPVFAGIWALSMLVINNLSVMFSSIGIPFTTLASEMDVGNTIDSLHKAVAPAMRVTAGLSMTAMSGCLIYGHDLIQLFLPQVAADGHAQALVFLVALLTAGMVVGLPPTVVRNVLLGTRKHWAVARWNLAGSGMGVLALAGAWSPMDFWAAVVTWWLAMLVPAFGLYFPQFLLQFNRPLYTLIWTIFGRALGVPFVLAVLAGVISTISKPRSMTLLWLEITVFSISSIFVVLVAESGVRQRMGTVLMRRRL